jgi:hypothetical protein
LFTFHHYKTIISNNLINLPGWHTKRKIVVIESDDWGALRMPSREIYDRMLAEGIQVDRDCYCRYDGLETSADLSALFDVLRSVEDKNGRHPAITADAVVANPDFEKIRKSNFQEYHYLTIPETMALSPRHADAWVTWKQGMSEGLIHPQFHGREHLNVKKWLNAIKDGNKTTRRAFDYGTFGLTSDVDPDIKGNYMGAFNSALPEDLAEYRFILTEGLDIFETLFGFRSESFISTTYTWPLEIEPVLKENGVRFLQGMVSQRIPLDDDTTFSYKNNNFSGRHSPHGLVYLQRNAYFEPAYNRKQCLENCLRRIELAFRWHKPAVISSHRVNFIGSIDAENSRLNLSMLKKLLDDIVTRWPEVEFMTSDELGRLMING